MVGAVAERFGGFRICFIYSVNQGLFGILVGSIPASVIFVNLGYCL